MGFWIFFRIYIGIIHLIFWLIRHMHHLHPMVQWLLSNCLETVIRANKFSYKEVLHLNSHVKDTQITRINMHLWGEWLQGILMVLALLKFCGIWPIVQHASLCQKDAFFYSTIREWCDHSGWNVKTCEVNLTIKRINSFPALRIQFSDLSVIIWYS